MNIVISLCKIIDGDWAVGKMRPFVKTWRFESNLICSKSFVFSSLINQPELEQSSNSKLSHFTIMFQLEVIINLSDHRYQTEETG